MVAVLFGKTVELENKMLDTSGTPQNTVNVIGKQWSWDFNYVNDKTYDTGQQAILNGKKGAEKTIPTLYLPVNKRTEFILTSRDVIHDFWVIAFLQKMDMIPGKVNKFDVTPTQIGTYRGKCANCAAPTTPRCCSTSRWSTPRTTPSRCSDCARPVSPASCPTRSTGPV